MPGEVRISPEVFPKKEEEKEEEKMRRKKWRRKRGDRGGRPAGSGAMLSSETPSLDLAFDWLVLTCKVCTSGAQTAGPVRNKELGVQGTPMYIQPKVHQEQSPEAHPLGTRAQRTPHMETYRIQLSKPSMNARPLKRNLSVIKIMHKF